MLRRLLTVGRKLFRLPVARPRSRQRWKQCRHLAKSAKQRRFRSSNVNRRKAALRAAWTQPRLLLQRLHCRISEWWCLHFLSTV